MDSVSQRMLSNMSSWMKLRISIKVSLQFSPKGLIDNIPALVQIMAWHRPCDKPLSETVVVSLLTYVCATRPQWVYVIYKKCKVVLWEQILYWHLNHHNHLENQPNDMCQIYTVVHVYMLYTPHEVEMDIQMDIWPGKTQRPGKVLVKACRAEFWASK